MQAYPSNIFCSSLPQIKSKKQRISLRPRRTWPPCSVKMKCLRSRFKITSRATVLALHESTEAELKKLKAEVKEKEAYLESAQTQGEMDRKAKESLEAEKQQLLSALSSSIFGE